MRTLNVILNGARGGQGTSTISAALALYAAGHADTQLVATDPSVTAALLGIPETAADDGEIAVTDRLTLTGTPSGDPQVGGEAPRWVREEGYAPPPKPGGGAPPGAAAPPPAPTPAATTTGPAPAPAPPRRGGAATPGPAHGRSATAPSTSSCSEAPATSPCVASCVATAIGPTGSCCSANRGAA